MAMSTPARMGILKFLDPDTTLKTPAFQRSFAWGRSQIADFWSDLARALDAAKGPEDYFLGLIVLDDGDQIQDGQQRLASTLLFAAALHEQIEAAKAAGPHDAQTAIDATGLVTPALRQSPSAPLVISVQDQEVLLNRTGITSGLPESARRLQAARTQLSQHLEQDLSTRKVPDARLARLKQWGEFLRNRAYTVLLRVPPKDAHNIFETLNTRGVRLTNGDLVKSHLIARATDTSLAVSKWTAVTNALSDSSGRYEDDLESYLLHYYGSRYRRTTKAQFFAAYRAATAGSDALQALDELLESARLYRALADPAGTAMFWSALGAGTGQAVELLNGLGLKQLRYLLLAVLRDFAANQGAVTRRKRQREAVLKTAAWSLRGLVLGRTGGGEAETTYITAAAAIRQGQITTVDKLRSHFIDRDMLVTDDKAFRERFLVFPFDSKFSHNRARAVLSALEHEKISKKSGLKPRETLTLEHVLPQSPEAGQWVDFTDGEREVYGFRLGNLLLIDGPSQANNLLRNNEWPAKRGLINSWGNQTPLTTGALKHPRWTKSTIDRRTGELADLALKAWGI